VEIEMTTKTLLSLVALAALSGCAVLTSPAHECGLDETPHAKCASMEQAYAAAKRADPKAKTTSVFDRSASKDAKDEAKPFFQGKESEMPEPGQQGMPVFAQPKVHRVWVAPYVDADGNLRTGEYTYFNTAGRWNYGSTNAPGAAAGSFGPAKPGNLGFTPVDKRAAEKAAQQQPSKPPVPAAANAHKGTATAKQASDAITQPYQRLND
jgi:type IV conjugative transfer system lipoprotein TraV